MVQTADNGHDKQLLGKEIQHFELVVTILNDTSAR